MIFREEIPCRCVATRSFIKQRRLPHASPRQANTFFAKSLPTFLDPSIHLPPPAACSPHELGRFLWACQNIQEKLDKSEKNRNDLDEDSCGVVFGTEHWRVTSDRLGLNALPWDITTEVVARDVDAREEAVFVESVPGPRSCVPDSSLSLDPMELSLIIDGVGSVKRVGIWYVCCGASVMG